MTLSPDALSWAIQFVADHSDGDLFPRVAEFRAIQAKSSDFVSLVANKPLSQFPPGAHRRFIVPKDEISYRQATQLYPQDSIILSAIVFEFGEGIEARRRPRSQVYSYRFAPTTKGGLYDSESAWNDFWENAAELSRDYQSILYCDISDFYNQIYHHVVENQLIESGFPNQATKWVIGLLESTTAGVSRGVPIGPHAAHLIAEASLIPIDNSLAASGTVFLRFADDILIFNRTERDSKRALARLASTLDKQQRLSLQKQKTRVFDRSSFIELAEKMIEDRPISREEAEVLEVVRRYSGGNPYRTISYNEIDVSDWQKLSSLTISNIVSEYVDCEEIDFIRLRWFYRRLAQIGHPGALEATLERIEQLTPCFASICAYIASIQSIGSDKWMEVGSSLISLLETEEIKDSEYFRLSILSLFSRNSEINHFRELADRYSGSDSFAKREIYLSAKAAGAIDWLREYKEDFSLMDPWQQLAFLFCMHDFPNDERKYFLNARVLPRPFETVVSDWAKKGI